MKRSLISTSLVLTMLLIVGWVATPVRFTFQPESQVWVEGTSSLHDWTCQVNDFDGMLEATSITMDELSQVRVTVPVKQLECKNGTMNRKTYKALASDDHPTITYELKASTLKPSEADGTFQLASTGALTIAGATKDVEMTVSGEPLDDGMVRLTGSLPLLMTDFGVDPPSAMLGTLKTGNEVTIHFDVVVAQ